MAVTASITKCCSSSLICG